MILNGLPWKRTEIILSFLRMHPSLEYDIYLSLSDSLLFIIGSRFIHIFRTNSNVFLFMTEKEESEKVGLNLNIQKTKIMASGTITSWAIDGDTVEQCQTFFFFAPKSLQMVTAAMKLKDAYSLEGKF